MLGVWQSSVTHRDHDYVRGNYFRMNVWPSLPNPGAERRLKERIRFLMTNPHLVGLVLAHDDISERFGPIDSERMLRSDHAIRLHLRKIELIEFPYYPPGAMFLVGSAARRNGWCWYHDLLWYVSPLGYLYPPPNMLLDDGIARFPEDDCAVSWAVDIHGESVAYCVVRTINGSIHVVEQFTKERRKR